MSDALYVVKVSGQFAGAAVAKVIENAGDVATVAAALRRGPYEDASKPYVTFTDVSPNFGVTCTQSTHRRRLPPTASTMHSTILGPQHLNQ